MARILVITDCKDAEEVEAVKLSLEKDENVVAVSDLDYMQQYLPYAWDVIAVWVDSVSVSQQIIAHIREADETPIMYWQPSGLAFAHVSICYQPSNFSSTLYNILAAKKDPSKRTAGPA